jgi:hypothetical protein
MIRKDGVAGMWEHLKDQFADLKATVMDTIMNIVQSQVIQAGIKWVLSLLSPVGAFVKAVMAIIEVVKFFIQRAAQIGELVKAFMESVTAIASGKVGAVAKSIENALGKAIPVLIGLLASILGIGGLADKVLGVIRKIRQRITAGITKFWNFIKAKGSKLLSKVGIGKKDKEEMKKEKSKDTRTLAEKQKDLDAGVSEGTQLLKDDNLDKKEIQKRLEVLEDTFDLQELKIVTDKTEKDHEVLYIYGKVNPDKKGEKVKKKKKKEHNKFYPTDIKEQLLPNGGKRITYKYAEGTQEFTVELAQNGYPVKVIGDKLTLHDLGRGFTQNPEGKLKNAGMDSAHIIANMFGGSGYKKAKNIVATSAEYNQIAMRGKEEEIKEFIKKTKNTNYFTMEVNLEYCGDSTNFDILEVRNKLKEYAKTDDERHQLQDGELKAKILQRLKQTNQERVKEVKYFVIIYLENGGSIPKIFKIKESDLLFGTK